MTKCVSKEYIFSYLSDERTLENTTKQFKIQQRIEKYQKYLGMKKYWDMIILYFIDIYMIINRI